MSSYIFDNAAEEPTAQRFASLEELYDWRTIRFLEATVVGPGWRCLEVGGGSGSIAAWLAERVGVAGHVLVTDIDPRFLATLAAAGYPQVEVRRHDIGVDPLPEGAFDLIHARLVLQHVPAAPAALARLAAALRPGGRLVIEDFDSLSFDRAFPTSDPEDAAVVRTLFAAYGEVARTRGTVQDWARSLYPRFTALGLQEVGMEGHLTIWPGRSTGARFVAASLAQIREPLVNTRLIMAEELDRGLALLEDPAFAIASPIMCTTWGRRP